MTLNVPTLPGPTEKIQILNNAAGTVGPFVLTEGGNYGITAHATWSAGNAQLQKLAADGVTFVNVGSTITADGFTTQLLAPGTYQVVITTASAVYLEIAQCGRQGAST